LGVFEDRVAVGDIDLKRRDLAGAAGCLSFSQTLLVDVGCCDVCPVLS
jgi:hypothetical protein